MLSLRLARITVVLIYDAFATAKRGYCSCGRSLNQRLAAIITTNNKHLAARTGG